MEVGSGVGAKLGVGVGVLYPSGVRVGDAVGEAPTANGP